MNTENISVGDTLRLTEGGAWDAERVGRLVTVTAVHEDRVTVEPIIRDGEPWFHAALVDDRYTAVKVENEDSTPEIPEDLIFTEYHPALLPLFAKAAKAANDAGYCSEYDNIAAAIGAPTRDEIRRLTSATWTVKVPFTVMVEVEVGAGDETEARAEVSRIFGNWDRIREHFDRAVGEPGDSGWGTAFSQNVTGFSGTAPDGYNHIRTTWEATETKPAPTA